MSAVYIVNRARTQLQADTDLVTIVAGAKPLRIFYAKLAGAEAAPAANEVVMAASSSGSNPGTELTIAKASEDSGAASFHAYTTWDSQPTLGEVKHRFTPNSNGGIDPFTAVPGGEIGVPPSGKISFRPASGTGYVVFNLMLEEIGG